ncbi:hypothetical protein KEJ37_06065 [Candidatus Bathyarchaeota archaeon]|nr:hypothetical protein [Candidatus Bathyarchaeota archaeon]
MMRTIESIIAIIIMLSAFLIASYLIVLPSPRAVSPLNLRALALTVVKNLDTGGYLSEVTFSNDDSDWNELQTVLSASFPPHIAYNLTVYEITESGAYVPVRTISNAIGNVAFTESVSYMVSSPDVTYKTVAQKISEGGKNLTLYILNCVDANGWWITGYTAQMLAQDVYKLLKPYFETIILVNSTAQLLSLLDGIKLTTSPTESVTDAIIINTFGEVMPIPVEYTQGYSRQGDGYSSSGGYARYCYTLGRKVRQYNWKWISIVGYPFFYVTNTVRFYNVQNGYGIYGIVRVGAAGLNAFLQGLNNENYAYDSTWITKDITADYGIQVQFTPEAYYRTNYYGIYPASEQSASRALPGPGAPNSVTSRYNLAVYAPVFNPVYGYYAAATFKHNSGKGALIAIGLTRTPDIRITALALLIYYKPNIFKETFTAPGKSRLIILQLAALGGV